METATRLDARMVQAYRRFAHLAALLVGLVGGAALVGWVVDVPLLTSWKPGGTAMVPMVALLLPATGWALWLLASEEGRGAWRHRLGAAIAGVLALMAVFVLVEYALGWNPGLDRALFPHTVGTLGGMFPGRPSVITALCFGLLAAAMGVLDAPSHWRVHPAEALALAGLCLPGVGFMGLAYGFASIVQESGMVWMALPTAVATALWGLGLLCARPTRGLMAAFAGGSPGSMVLRRVVPALVLVPPLLGWLRIQAERSGHLSTTLGVALMVALMVAGALGFTLWNAATLDRLDRERERSERAEEVLKANEARFRGLLESAPDAMVIVNRAGRIVQVNREAERQFGYERPALLGQPVEMLMPERYRRVHVEHRGRFYAAPHARTMGQGLELFALRRDGSEFPVEISLSPLATPEGLLVIAALRDITERKRALEEIASRTAELKKAHELNALKDHFLSMISHEMKTPLALIMGYTELLEDAHPEAGEAIAGIKEGTRRLYDHIESVLEYSALVSGSMPLYRSEVDLAEVLDNITAITEEGRHRRNLTLETAIAPDTPVIQADSRRVTQMVLELVENAEKFTPPGGRIGVCVGPAGEMVRIDVWDTGPGISEADFPRVWEAFSQLAVGDAVRQGGLGLGLTIVKQLAELHGGRVALVSQPGHGATFTIYLPVQPPGPSGNSQSGNTSAKTLP